MLFSQVDLDSGVFTGPENNPRNHIPKITDAFGQDVKRTLEGLYLDNTRSYGIHPFYRTTFLTKLLVSLKDRISMIGLDLGIQTHEQREIIISEISQQGVDM